MVRYANFYHCLPEERIGPRFIHDFQLLLVQAGHGEATIGGQRYSAASGDVFFYGPGQPHQIVSAETPTLRLLGIHFVFVMEARDWTEAGGIALSSRLPAPEDREITCPLKPAPPAKSTPGPEVFRLAQQIVLSYSISGHEHAVRQRGLMLLLLAAWLANPASRALAPDEDAQPVRRAQTILHAGFRRQLRRDEVARQAGLSPAHFSRLFRRVTGQTFQDYLIFLRLSHARQLLLEGSLSIAEVARESGFQDPYYFSRLFHRRVGCSPREYQRGTWPLEHESP
jgi:AraC-like DNA-binding protein